MPFYMMCLVEVEDLKEQKTPLFAQNGVVRVVQALITNTQLFQTKPSAGRMVQRLMGTPAMLASSNVKVLQVHTA